MVGAAVVRCPAKTLTMRSPHTQVDELQMVSQVPQNTHGVFLTSGGVFASEMDGRRVLGYECRFEQQSYADDLYFRHGIRFPPQLAAAIAKRKSTYLAGRICAQRLFLHLGLATPAVDIPIGADRCPVWPPGIIASISHTDSRAACIASTDPDMLGLGIDIEGLLTVAQAAEVVSQLIDASEEAILRSAFPSFECGLSVAFSAKESLFKALYPSVGHFFDFNAARIRRVRVSSVELEIVEALSERLKPGSRLHVAYRIEECVVVTLASFTRGSTP